MSGTLSMRPGLVNILGVPPHHSLPSFSVWLEVLYEFKLLCMKLQTSQRSSSPMKILLSGPSGAGKTYSALQLARGLSESWENICIIDTEHGSADLYSHHGAYKVIKLDAPFHPTRYIEAIKIAIEAGMECIIIDSISHEWSGKGGCLELHEKTTSSMKVPNSFAAWGAVTPHHQSFIDAVVSSSVHIIATARSKTEYILVERNGKQVPQKVGMAPMLRDGTEYEFSIHLELDQLHRAHCTKDRTQLFQDGEPFQINTETGKKILKWITGDESHEITRKISSCNTMKELRTLFELIPIETQEKFKHLFRGRKAELLSHNITPKSIMEMPVYLNGHH